MRSALVIGAVSALLLTACGAAGQNLYSSVPASDWPKMDGVVVVRSKGHEGNQCCEPNPGSRQLVVRLDDPHGTPLLTLQQLMDDAGWEPMSCAFPEPVSKKLCAQTGGLLAVLTLPRSEAKQDEGLVHVSVERTRY